MLNQPSGLASRLICAVYFQFYYDQTNINIDTLIPF